LAHPNVKICAYCGADGKALTKDHIPPQNLFPEPRSSDLITVPCCEECRGGWSDDDEYFRLAVASTSNVFDHPDAKAIISKVSRSLKKPTKIGFAKLVRDSLGEIDIQSQGGIYLGKAPSIKINANRLDRVSQRIIRGLYFKERNYPVPSDCGVFVKMLQYGFEDYAEHLSGIRFPPFKDIAGGIFSYTWVECSDDPDASIWLMLFFGNLPFVGFVDRDVVE
jgi:hypothetical protein